MPSPQLIPTDAYFSIYLITLDNQEGCVYHEQVLLPMSETVQGWREKEGEEGRGGRWKRRERGREGRWRRREKEGGRESERKKHTSTHCGEAELTVLVEQLKE